VVSFTLLWRSHPANQHPQEVEPCRDKNNISAYQNQCAIRMGIALQLAGISVDTFTGAFCWHGHGRSHILRAQELADWLRRNPYIAGQLSVVKNANSTCYTGKKGIVFIRNFFGQGNQGDHIDVWNGTRMSWGSPQYFGRAQEVWFWELP
jgi:hypothetical protein